MSKLTSPRVIFLKLPEVLKLIPVGRSTWYAGLKSGRYPKPIKISQRSIAWRLEDIQKFINNLKNED